MPGHFELVVEDGHVLVSRCVCMMLFPCKSVTVMT